MDSCCVRVAASLSNVVCKRVRTGNFFHLWQVVLIPLDYIYTRAIFAVGISCIILAITAWCKPAARSEDNYLAFVSQACLSTIKTCMLEEDRIRCALMG